MKARQEWSMEGRAAPGLVLRKLSLRTFVAVITAVLLTVSQVRAGEADAVPQTVPYRCDHELLSVSTVGQPVIGFVPVVVERQVKGTFRRFWASVFGVTKVRGWVAIDQGIVLSEAFGARRFEEARSFCQALGGRLPRPREYQILRHGTLTQEASEAPRSSRSLLGRDEFMDLQRGRQTRLRLESRALVDLLGEGERTRFWVDGRDGLDATWALKNRGPYVFYEETGEFESAGSRDAAFRCVFDLAR